MSSLLLVLIVAGVCFWWVQSNRQHRQRWLARLDLPGTWLREGEDGSLELDGDLDRGRYRLRDGDEDEQGAWELKGHDLVLTPRRGVPCVLDLRLFSEGKIGLHGAGREHRIYVKRRGNVVPLRRNA
jgi:hypothetical protein